MLKSWISRSLRRLQKQYFRLLRRLMQIEEPEFTQDEPANASNVELNLDI